MRDKIISNDYIGFTFNGIHSSQLGIIRTSDGSRFNENLLPTMQDKTVQVPGGDGTYYFGSYYTQKSFTIPFAFEDLTEEEFAALKRWLGDKGVHELWFDEAPYKYYRAKVTGSATIKHIPFGTTGERVYKGEGSVQFTAFQPFARSRFKWLNQVNYSNVEEWKNASGMKKEQGTYDQVNDNGNAIPLFNPGDKEAHFQLALNFVDGKIPKGHIAIDNQPSRALYWKEIKQQGADAYVRINTKLNLIEGYDEFGNKSGNVYNSSIIDGVFFQIPRGESDLILGSDLTGNISAEPIEYDYIYF